MAEDGFEALDEAAVAGAHGLGWGPPPLLSPVDILAIDDFHRFPEIDVFLKPSMQAPVDPVALRDALAGSAATAAANAAAAVRPVTVAPGGGSGDLPPAPPELAIDSKPLPRARPKQPAAPRRRGAVRKKSAQRKQTRATEALEYGSLADIAGTTAARSRQMNEEERRVMLHKRRLRNRASAARSREKRCRTITELGKEIAGLLEKTGSLTEECDEVKRENQGLKEENLALREKLGKLYAEKLILEKDNLVLRTMK